MKAELSCEVVRVELSARLDGESDPAAAAEVDRHLAGCRACRTHEQDLARVRRVLRLQPAEEHPDLVPAVLERLEGLDRGRPARRRREWTVRLRLAWVAAVVAAVVAGASLPWSDDAPETAAASEIAAQVRRAARTLDAYRATYEILEWGWHPRVPRRNLAARLWFRAPEEFRLEVRDHTSYPRGQGWPVNDIDLVADADRWFVRRPTFCPPAALPGCAGVRSSEERVTVIDRQPFDGSSPLPTDLVVPLETLAGSSGFKVLGQDAVIGRSAYVIELPYARAIPLVGALQSGGSWRPFHPLDPVRVHLDRRSRFPLAFEVYAGSSSDREAWERDRELADQPGQRIFSVRATRFSAGEDIPDRIFEAPSDGSIRSGGFQERGFNAAGWPAPSYTAGLNPYRAGVAAGAQRVLTYAEGMTWLKIVARPLRGPALFPTTAEEIKLPGGYGYYQPADETLRRRLEVYGKTRHYYLESNLGRSELLRVGESLNVRGKKAPALIASERGYSVRRLSPGRAIAARPFTRAPEYLPEGYRPSTALLSRSRTGPTTITIFYRRLETEFDKGVRITQSAPVDVLPPSSEDLDVVPLANGGGRWSATRGELEWVSGGVYRAVAVPSFDLGTALRIASSLR